MPTKQETDALVNKAAVALRKRFGLKEKERIHIGIILGTGWGETLRLKDAREMSLAELPGFESLGSLPGHARTIVCGYLSGGKKRGQRIIAQRGRIHLNESFTDPRAPLMVRLQVELMMALGAQALIFTAAVGSLKPEIRVGSVIVVDGFVTCFAPDMPLHTGEFCSPEDRLDPAMQVCALQCGAKERIPTGTGGHAMVRGPFFEGRKYDKVLLRNSGASVVGMSILPETCVAALSEQSRVLALGHVTNSAFEEHSHEIN